LLSPQSAGLDVRKDPVEAGLDVVRELKSPRRGAQLGGSGLETVEQRPRPARLPCIVASRIEEVTLPDLPEVLARGGRGQLVATRPHPLDLVQRQRVIIDGRRRHERVRPAEQVVAEDDGLVAALQAAFEAADILAAACRG